MSRFRRQRGQQGAAAVEFALVVPILLLLLFGMVQYGWYFYSMQSGTSATGDAVRRLSVGACQNAGQRQTLITSELGGAMSGSSLITNSVAYTTLAGGASPKPVVGGSVTLTVKYNTVNFHFPLIKLPGGGTVQRIQTARVEATTAAAGTTCS